MKTLITAAAGLGLAAAVTIAAPSAADPKGTPVPVSCDDGLTYMVAVNGNGPFTPGHDIGSTSVLVPTAFGEFHGTVTDAAGTVLEEFTDPAIAKGSSTKPRGTAVSCSFTISEQFEDPDLGLITFTGSGTLEGFVTPVR
jgi:hypothetical protein